MSLLFMMLTNDLAAVRRRLGSAEPLGAARGGQGEQGEQGEQGHKNLFVSRLCLESLKSQAAAGNAALLTF
jgi:hypothetical protein